MSKAANVAGKKCSTKGIFLIAFSCGVLALALEVILCRLALRGVGSNAYAATITITVYLMGMALGALTAQKCALSGRRKVIQYSPLLLVTLTLALACGNAFLNDWLTVACALFLPSFCSAIFVSSLASTSNDDKISANAIYCINNLGSWCGALLAGFVLLPGLGISASLMVLALASTPAALMAYGLRSINAIDESEELEHHESFNLTHMVLLLVCGLTLTVLESAWIRLSALISGSSTQIIAAVIASVVGALALGNALALQLMKKPRHIPLLRSSALTLSALTCFFSFKCLLVLPQLFQNVRAAIAFADDEWQYILPRFLVATLLAFPASFFIGTLFPLYTNRLSRSDWRKAFTASSIGAAAGPALFTFVMLDLTFYQSSLEGTLRISGILLGTMALVAIAQAILYRQSLRLSTALLLTVSLVTIVFSITSAPLNCQKLVSGLAYFPATEDAIEQTNLEQKFLPLRFYKDGRNSTISVEENKFKNVLILKSDGKVEASIPAVKGKPAGESDLATQSLLCLLPALRHRESSLNCLIIGQGSGTTSGIAATLPKIANVDVVEIEPQMVQASRLFPYSLPGHAKINIIEADARAFLRREKEKPYDLIISQPAEPWVAGSSGLFTREFFRLTRSRLASSGLMTQWLQLYGLSEGEFICAIKTFADVYPNTMIFHQHGAGEIILVGAMEADKHLNERYKKIFLSAPYRDKLAAAGIGSWQSFSEAHLLSSDALAKFINLQAPAALNTDDNLKLEYGAGRHLNNKNGGQEKCLAANLAILAKYSDYEAANLSIEQVEKELLVDSSAYKLMNVKAKQILAQGGTTEALALLQKSKALNPSSVITHELLAMALTMSGKFEEALSETQVAHQLNTSSCRPYLIAFTIYQAMGNAEMARWNLNKAGQICPESEILRQVTLPQENRPPAFNVRTGLPSGTLKSNLTRLLQVVGE